MADEREILEDIIRELNVTWRETLGLSVDLLRWETHATPGMAADPQKVINESIGDDYDIFIGIMWSRFGTATTSHGSGTEEEYSRALERWKADPASVRIMFYFNQSGVSMDAIDLKQAAKIQDFKESLGEEGTLYWNYKDKEHFREILRLHLSRVIQEWTKPSEKTAIATVSKQPTAAEPSDAEDELGFLDLMESLEDSINTIGEITNRMLEAITEVGENMSMRGEELNKLDRNEKDQLVDYKSAKRITNKASQDLDRFNASMDHEVPLFQENNATIAKSSSNLALVMGEFDRESDEELAELDEMLGKLCEALETVPTNIEGFRDTVAGIPRVSVKYNRSKKTTVRLLDSFLDAIAESLAVYSESRSIIQTLREKHAQSGD